MNHLVRYIKKYQKQTFTWVDGLIDREMAQKIRDTHFTDVIFRDREFRIYDYMIADDDMAANGFWEKYVAATGTVGESILTDDTETKIKGANSLKFDIPSGTYGVSGIRHTFSPALDMSKKDFFWFWWYGKNTGSDIRVGFDFLEPGTGNWGMWKFVDNFSGWKLITFELTEPFETKSGTKDWSQVSRVWFESYIVMAWNLDQFGFGKWYDSKYDEALNASNLHEVGLRAWGFIICPNHGEDFNSYFTSKKADYPNVDGFYVDDTQILFETGGDVTEWNQMVESAYNILGADAKDVIIEAVAGWNGQVADPSQLIAKDFDYYANIDHDYTVDAWPQCTTKGIYVWLYKNASTVSKSQVEGIYTQAGTLACKRLTVWQWYFAGEADAPPEGCSICYYPKLIVIITEQNKVFLGSPTTVVELEKNEIIPSSQFDKRTQAKGLDINIIQLTYAGLDPYGNPVHSEAATTVKGFVKFMGREKATPAGTVKLGKAVFLVSLNAVVLKDDYEISYGGTRWKITAVNPKRSHLEILAEAKIEKETKVE